MSTSNEIYALLRSPDVDNNYDEVQSIIDSDRSILRSTNRYGSLPIHFACSNPHVTLRIIQLLLNGWPESISQPNPNGDLPIHCLCENKNIEDTVSVQILTFLLEAYPESVQRQNLYGGLPIHVAAGTGMSSKFLKILVNEYSQSVRIPDANDYLPIHWACSSDNCRLDTVEYLLESNPESVDNETDNWWWPIHHAARSNGLHKTDIIKYLLTKDPNCASKVTDIGDYPLHLACWSVPNLKAVQLLFDAYPEAILASDRNRYTPLERALDDNNSTIINFLQKQLEYAEKAQDVVALSALDENGWTPLHQALKKKASLGSIKLLIKGNTLAVHVPDTNMAFPLHIACQYSTIEVVQYLMDMLDERMKNHLDVNKDSILHYACRGGNCEVVKYLLYKQRSPHVAERNADEKLPIHLLCQFGLPASSLEHTDTIYRLLLAYPETL